MSIRPFSQPDVRPLSTPLPRLAWRLIACWCRRRRQRVDLSELDDHLLADIGVTPQEARCEIAKPFWR